jgi:FkbH-like protein
MEPIADLCWLPPAPDDFAARAKALRAADSDISAALRALATFRLDPNQLHRLARIVDEKRGDEDALGALTALRIGILSNATTDFIVPAITGSALRHGLAIECVTGAFGQFMQDALDPASSINRARCDAVLLAIDARGYGLSGPLGDAAGEEAALAAAIDRVRTIHRAVAERCPTVVIQSVAARPETLLGSYDARLPGAEAHVIAEFNRRLADLCSETAMPLLDISALAQRVGTERWHDPVAWYIAQQPFSHSLIPAYAEAVARLLGAVRGKSRKALVLDLDNTCWSGVIGDDGMEGINLSPGDPVGDAHLALQSYALALRDCGILLAICSKNTDAVARRVFREHPDMLLREEHIAKFQANWTDKPANLLEIAEALNLGVESLVFVDDNPAERELVRQKLPQVAVPELPGSPALYVRTLAAASYFEAVSLSSEDRSRARFYVDNAKRVAVEASAGGIDDYLRSIEMTINFAPFDERGRARITQLINKSNQFNLTTRRYTEAEVALLGQDPAVTTLQVRLKDKFGDNGMISTVICRDRGSEREIDTWLMSCRVLGRRVEEAVLVELIRRARENGIARLIGIYRPTERNGIVAGHYEKLGFTPDPTDRDRWVLEINQTSGLDFPDVFSEILYGSSVQAEVAK